MQPQRPNIADTDAHDYGTVPGRTPRPHETRRAWHALGEPWNIFLEAAQAVGKQCIALVLLVMQLRLERDGQGNHLMRCSGHGTVIMSMCEYSKAYVRCFPLIGIIVSLMAAARLILYHRAFYELLRHDVLVDFENFNALRDPLVLILLWCIAHALFHFCLHIVEEHVLSGHLRQDVEDGLLLKEVEEMLIFFAMPTVFFMVFLLNSYDVEATLVPMSKYIEEEPESVRKAVSSMPFFEEPVVAVVVHNRLKFEGKDGAPCTAQDQYRALVAKAQRIANNHEKMLKAGELPDLSRFRLASKMWPATLLLDNRLTDKGSRHFRYWWYGFCALSLSVMAYVAFIFVERTLDDCRDVMDGQTEDGWCVAVELAHACATIWLAHCFLKNVLVPFYSVSDPPNEAKATGVQP